MASVVTRTVKSAGGDYSSLATAEAGEQTNLVTADVQLDIECYAMSDTSAVTISGWTTDATRYLRVVAPASERHDGKWNTSKYRLVVPNADALTISEEYVRLEGLQIHKSTSNGSFQDVVIVTGIAAGGSDIRIDSCLLRQAGNNSFNEICLYIDDADAVVTVRNSVLYGTGNAGTFTSAIWLSAAATLVVENSTLVSGMSAIYHDTRAITLKNSYAHGGSATYTGTGTRTLTTCAHSSAASYSGSTASVAHSTANFVSVTSGSEDYHLVSGSALIDAGTDLSATFTTDIDGNTRSGTWDIGADEFQGGGGGGGTSPFYYYAMMEPNRG